ncbi:MAG: hypothetical protein IOC82_02795 [Aestuariivirga sp.]|uniref:hypothetical protein n=1 Tax=Aestuariivirga sp. TaxID=2650926 RepID=UPI0025B85AAC|nr:hypothetical protein [Aestuariivirga sp.]MCA3559942.1 hypothetical protein [Aestuariivirga sp.]
MSVPVSDGPAIVVDYECRLQLEAESDLFPAGATFTEQLRAKVSAAMPVTTLNSGNGGVTRVTDRIVELVVPATETASLSPGSAVLDPIRTDLTLPRHLVFMLEIPVVQPVTRGLG